VRGGKWSQHFLSTREIWRKNRERGMGEEGKGRKEQ